MVRAPVLPRAAATRTDVPAARSLAWRQPGVLLSAGGLLLAVAAEAGGPTAGVPDAWLLPSAVAVYAGLLVSWHAAVGRVSGAPTVWFTAAVPVVAAVAAIGTEAVNAYGIASDTSAIPLALIPVALMVTFAGAHRSGRRWKWGLLAWSMALFHLGIATGALAGIPLDTFGDATRSDEVLIWGGVLPLVAMGIAALFAPRTPWSIRLAGPALVAAVIPTVVVTGTFAAGLAAITVLALSTTAVGRARLPRRRDDRGEGI